MADIAVRFMRKLSNRCPTMRVPAQAIQRRIIKELHATGFEGISMPHMTVLRFPSPDGARPAFLPSARHKQAGREPAVGGPGGSRICRPERRAGEGRARIVHFTKRGQYAYATALQVLRDIEREWNAELGPKDFVQLKELLCRVWESPLIR